jgi:hypothetical protein
MSAALEAVIRSPRFPLYVEELTRLLEKEHAARRRVTPVNKTPDYSDLVKAGLIFYYPPK